VVWALISLLVALLAAAWVTVRAVAAKQHLDRVQDQLPSLERALVDQQMPQAHLIVARMQADSAAAVRLTHDPLWGMVTQLPILGDNPRAVRKATEAVDLLVGRSLPSLLRSARLAKPSTLVHGDTVAVDDIAALHAPVAQASGTASLARRRIREADGVLLPPVRSAVARLRTRVDGLARALSTATRATQVLPAMLGRSERRTYLLVVQNPAEARGTGGILGAYGVIEADRGRLRLREISPNSRLKDSPSLPVALGADYSALYGNDPGVWRNSNLSPHFPYAGRVWLALWQKQFGRQLDGVVALDPITLGALVGATGPISLDAETRLTGATTADFVMSGVYRRFPRFNQNRPRDRLLARLGELVATNVLSGRGDPGRLIQAASRAATHRRLLVYSTRPGEQRVLASGSIGGAMPISADPFVEVVVNNGGGNKLDYYLDRMVRYSGGACIQGRRSTRITIVLTNRAPAIGLPPYVTGLTTRDAGVDLPAGTNRLLVYVFATRGATLQGAELDGVPVSSMVFGRELRRPVFAFTVNLRPGQSRSAVLALTEPASSKPARIVEQPLVRPQRSVVAATTC